MGDGGVAASDVVRSMKREGFVDDEIYDVLTGIGLPGEQVQLLIDRVSAEFEEAGLEPRASRLGTEVREIFKEVLGEVQHKILSRMDEFSRELQLVKGELEKLSNRITALQSTTTKGHVKTKEPLPTYNLRKKYL